MRLLKIENEEILNRESKAKIKKSSAGNYIISECEFEQIITRASKEGARLALHELGLDDDHAHLDIRDLRELLNAFKMAKRHTFKIFIKWLVLGVMTLITAGFLSFIIK